MRVKLREYRYLLFATTLILLGALTACQPAAAPAPTAPPAGATTAAGLPTLSVLAAESFIADMAQNVAGDRLNVETLMPPWPTRIITAYSDRHRLFASCCRFSRASLRLRWHRTIFLSRMHKPC